MPVLQRLIYRSTATGRTDSLLNAATLLGEAQRNNARDGLTGALAAHEGDYIQIIEGEAGALDNLLRRLDRDPRHRDLRILSRDPIATRSFAGWGMANARITPDQGPMLAQLMAQDPPSPEALTTLLKEAVGAPVA